ATRGLRANQRQRCAGAAAQGQLPTRSGQLVQGTEPADRHRGAVTTPLKLYKLATTSDENYPRLLTSHPRNRDIDWRAVDDYATAGVPIQGQFDLFVKTDQKIDTVYISGLDPVISERLRAVLEPLVGGPATFLPLTVNGRPFWIMKVRHTVDALDLEHSDVT